MNKYQEALNIMRDTIQEIDMRTDVCTNIEVKNVINATYKLQELVDLYTKFGLPYPKDNNYFITEDGKVFRNGKELKQHIINGYYCVTLSKNNKQKKVAVHKLVAETYLNNEQNKKYINHKDCNKQNNNASNLEYCTHQENMQHAWENGLIKKEMFEKSVIQFDTDMNLIKQHKSIKQACQYLGIRDDNSHISSCCKGKYKTAYGYIWKYTLDWSEDDE